MLDQFQSTKLMSLNSKEFECDNIHKTKGICNTILYNSKGKLLNSKCFYCGSGKNSICNSHFVPRSYLSNIAENGQVCTANSLIYLPILDKESGIKKAGTFHLICSNCDNRIFQDYENYEFKTQPDSRILSQIALKNYLKMIYKRKVDYNMCKEGEAKVPNMADYFIEHMRTANIDIEEYIAEFKKVKRGINTSKHIRYELLYYNELNYVVPIAFQSSIVIVFDFNGRLLNNVYIDKRKLKMKDIHLCIFPLKSKSIIMIFYDGNSNKYREFRKQFQKFPASDKLAIVNYIVFKYSEDMFFSKKIRDEALNSGKLIEAAKSTFLACSNENNKQIRNEQILKLAKKEFDLNRFTEIPNFLAEQYKIIHATI